MLDLVMIPAFGCDAGLYAKIAPDLADMVRSQTIIADRPDFAACAAQILAAAPPSFIVLGTSFGGRVALEVTLSAPERVKGLVVIGAGPRPSPDLAAGLRRSERLRSGDMEGVLKEMGDMVSHLPGPEGPAARDAFITMGRAMGAEAMARQSDALAHRRDLGPRLREISCPAMMLWGHHDLFVSAADGLALAAAISGARFVEIAGCGHFPTLEAPDETVAAFDHWLSDAIVT